MHFAIGLIIVLAIIVLFIAVAFPDNWKQMIQEIQDLKSKKQ